MRGLDSKFAAIARSARAVSRGISTAVLPRAGEAAGPAVAVPPAACRPSCGARREAGAPTATRERGYRTQLHLAVVHRVALEALPRWGARSSGRPLQLQTAAEGPPRHPVSPPAPHPHDQTHRRRPSTRSHCAAGSSRGCSPVEPRLNRSVRLVGQELLADARGRLRKRSPARRARRSHCPLPAAAGLLPRAVSPRRSGCRAKRQASQAEPADAFGGLAMPPAAKLPARQARSPHQPARSSQRESERDRDRET